MDRHRRTVERLRERDERRCTSGGSAGSTGVANTRVHFCGLGLDCNERVFFPRIGTAETVVRRAQELLSEYFLREEAASWPAGEDGRDTETQGVLTRTVRVLDLGTGSGCLLLAAISARIGSHGSRAGVLGVGVDNDEEAVRLAAHNAGLVGASDCTKWVCADFGRLHEQVVRAELGGEPFDMVTLTAPVHPRGVLAFCTVTEVSHAGDPGAARVGAAQVGEAAVGNAGM